MLLAFKAAFPPKNQAFFYKHANESKVLLENCDVIELRKKHLQPFLDQGHAEKFNLNKTQSVVKF